ncbi:DUF1269 domain-containing protein [Winogradskyella thalassocola]|uniref:Uncharacterized membrane protein n=1 Tax=Winogradskyella thalassocola TaxID=262004 RepID=A0A1G8BDK0_9FLAO|nr:DUF1269 domain-containing protein [Winogradskyella thalassocola]SDH31103.1 Uncharacterized membrane protein [Winogradskyella thalassocola]
MAHIIIVSFKEETKAIDALHKMKELDSYGDITLYEHLMIRKNENDKYDVLNDQTDNYAWRTFTGMALGGLIGAFAGPIGLVVCLYSGTALGAILDVGHYNFEDHFIAKVTNKMEVGDITIIAEVGEDSAVFIDNYLKPFNVNVIRTEADIEFDHYIDEQIDDIEDDIEDEREKLKKATANEKAKIITKINALKAQRKAKLADLEAKRKSTLQKVKDKTKSKIHTLETRLHDYEDSISKSISNIRKNRLKKRIKREEEKLFQLHTALDEDVVD